MRQWYSACLENRFPQGSPGSIPGVGVFMKKGKTMIKLLNLNLWNYNNFKERKPKIIKFIKKHGPDIITLQEVRDDIQFNKKGYNQSKQLNEELRYPYYEFYATTNKQKERPEKYKHYCIEGLSVLSKFPIIKTEKIKLKKEKGDKYSQGSLYVRLKAKKVIDLIDVHFSNNSYFSLLHLLETLKYIKNKKINPIISGDFNIIDSGTLHKLTEKEYRSSLKFKRYLSYPPANYTLDYILIPKRFRFKSLKCLGEGLSDHKALIAEIEIK